MCNRLDLKAISIIFSEIESVAADIISEKQNCMILFHGSKLGIKDNITLGSRATCDFGKGFYMSTDPYQPLSLIGDSDEAKFYVLSMDTKGLSEKEFSTDLDWILFVAFNRGYMNDFKDSKIVEKYKKMSNGIDIIKGSMVTDSTFYVLENFFRGNITNVALMKCLSVLDADQQYVAITNKACSRIKIEREIKIPRAMRQEIKKMCMVNRENNIALVDRVCRRYRREGLYFDEILASARNE